MIAEGRLEEEQRIGTRIYMHPKEVAENEWWRFVAKERIVVTELPVTHVEMVRLSVGDRPVQLTIVEGRGRKVKQ